MSTEKKDGLQPPAASTAVTTTPPTERTLADKVLTRLSTFTNTGSVKLPANYIPGNSLKLAWLMLLQTETTNKQPVLNACTEESIANALLEMCLQGLNPMKNQCYFIAYGNKLEMQRSYQGSMAVAKQVAPVLSIRALVIYEGDIFEYSVDHTTGLRHVTKHEQVMENIDINKIRGAYAIATFSDGTDDMEVMTKHQIQLAWKQGFGGGNTKAHQNFTDEMCKKTVIGRLCKSIINNSDDSALFNNEDIFDVTTENAEATIVTNDIKANANVIEIGLEEKKPVIASTPAAPAPIKPVAPTSPGKASTMDEGTVNAITLALTDCKTKVDVDKVEQSYFELKDNEDFKRMITAARASKAPF